MARLPANVDLSGLRRRSTPRTIPARCDGVTQAQLQGAHNRCCRQERPGSWPQRRVLSLA
eukprot:1107383-Amphidinium_carterae.1